MHELLLNQARELIAGFLVTRRKELGMTQQDLADATGLGIQTIKRMEDAKFWPNMKQFLIVCHALNAYFFVEEKEGNEHHVRVDIGNTGKPSKWIVFREFDSEEDAINLRSQLNHYGFSGYDEADNEYEDKSKWEIEKR